MNFLKVTFFSFAGFFGFAAFSMAKPLITCRSVDVTFRPFYTVEIQRKGTMNPGNFSAKITETKNLAGTQKKIIRKKGHGRITAGGFFIDFDGGGKIEGKRLSNGFLKGELSLNESIQELSCRE